MKATIKRVGFELSDTPKGWTWGWNPKSERQSFYKSSLPINSNNWPKSYTRRARSRIVKGK